MSIHVPEICFEATNFTLIESRKEVSITSQDGNDAFWSVLFQVNDVSEQRLRVLYGWKADARWLAPKFPRWSVADAGVLYKLQLSELRTSGSDGESAGIEFLEVFLPVLNSRLNASGPQTP